MHHVIFHETFNAESCDFCVGVDSDIGDCWLMSIILIHFAIASSSREIAAMHMLFFKLGKWNPIRTRVHLVA